MAAEGILEQFVKSTSNVSLRSLTPMDGKWVWALVTASNSCYMGGRAGKRQQITVKQIVFLFFLDRQGTTVVNKEPKTKTKD